jgi:hypothetical protein
MYGGQPNTSKSKELPGIHGAHSAVRASSNNRDDDNSYSYKKRNASGNHRNIIGMHNQAMGGNHNLYNSSNATPSKMGKGNHLMSPQGAMGGLHGLNSINL